MLSPLFAFPLPAKFIWGRCALRLLYPGARASARPRREESGRVAGAVGAILALATSVMVLAGVLLTPYLIWVIAPGFEGPKRELTVRLVRILFPGAGLLVFSAWSLGILNSHRKFFLSYTAPVIWNFAMIATMVAFRAKDLRGLTVCLAWPGVEARSSFSCSYPSCWR